MQVKELKKTRSMLEKHAQVILHFQEFWEKRSVIIKELVKGKDFTKELLLINHQEDRLIRLIEENEETDAFLRLSKAGMTELDAEYVQMAIFSKAWFSVIGIHKNFLEVEKRTIKDFMNQSSARREYFKALEFTLQAYSKILLQHDKEKIVAESINGISKKNLTHFSSTTVAGSIHGWYRVISATLANTTVTGAPLPGGGTVDGFLGWSLVTAIAGALLSIIDIKYSVALKIKNAAEDMLFVAKAKFHSL